MLKISLPWWEFVIRALVIYSFLFIGLRLTGKRQVGQLAPFDFILLLILSNAVQNSMNGGDNSLTGGLILASSLIGLNWILGYLQFKNKKLAYWIEGKPTILIHNGRINETELQNEKISHEELNSALRKNGITQVSDVKYAIIEANGNISVIAKLKN